MALRLEITRAVQLGADRIFLQWNISGTPLPTNPVFTLERSLSPQGPWEFIVNGRSLANYIDTAVLTPDPQATFQERSYNTLSLARQLYYRVTATLADGTYLRTTSPVEPGLNGRQKQARKKMLRDAAVLMVKGNGVPVAVCKRARWGPRCERCFDPYTGDIIHGECRQCYGTGFVPGYFAPVVTYARRSPNATQSAISEGGKTDVNNVQITLLDVPKVQDDDMLVFLLDNSRYVVRTTTQTELKTVGVHQEVVASELAHSSIEFEFEVDPNSIPKLF